MFCSKVSNISIIQCYAPTELADDNEKDEFYSRLNTVDGSTPRGDIVIVMGDLNAYLGVGNSGVENVLGKHGVGVRNDSGGRLVDFCSNHHLVIGGTTLQQRTLDKVSWQHPSGRHANQNDHLDISRIFRGCIEHVRNRKVADIGNTRDHYMMVTMLRLNTAAIKQPDERAVQPPLTSVVALNPRQQRHC